jgi:predicted RNase H-like HicB family nuclease
MESRDRNQVKMDARRTEMTRDMIGDLQARGEQLRHTTSLKDDHGRGKCQIFQLIRVFGTDRGAVDTPLLVELIPDPELGGFTARIPDIPAYGEGETEDEAIVDLKEALRAYIEAFGIDDALARANVPLTVRPLDWTLQDLIPADG